MALSAARNRLSLWTLHTDLGVPAACRGPASSTAQSHPQCLASPGGVQTGHPAESPAWLSLLEGEAGLLPTQMKVPIL